MVVERIRKGQSGEVNDSGVSVKKVVGFSAGMNVGDEKRWIDQSEEFFDRSDFQMAIASQLRSGGSESPWAIV